MSVTKQDINKMFQPDISYDVAKIVEHIDANGKGDSVTLSPKLSESRGSVLVVNIHVNRWRENMQYMSVGLYSGITMMHGILDTYDKEQASAIIKAALDHAKKG